MMDLISFLYLKKIVGRIEGEPFDPYTLSYKYGISQDVSKRDTRGEFLKYANATTPSSLPIKYEVPKVDDIIMISGPKFFITSLEEFLKKEFFERDKKFFSNKTEYILCCEETYKKFSELHKILQSEEPKLSDLQKGYEDLKDTQVAALKMFKSSYDVVLDGIKSSLKKFLHPISADKVNAVMGASKNAAVPTATGKTS